jgi:hypothetical protein
MVCPEGLEICSAHMCTRYMGWRFGGHRFRVEQGDAASGLLSMSVRGLLDLLGGVPGVFNECGRVAAVAVYLVNMGCA